MEPSRCPERNSLFESVVHSQVSKFKDYKSNIFREKSPSLEPPTPDPPDLVRLPRRGPYYQFASGPHPVGCFTASRQKRKLQIGGGGGGASATGTGACRTLWTPHSPSSWRGGLPSTTPDVWSSSKSRSGGVDMMAVFFLLLQLMLRTPKCLLSPKALSVTIRASWQIHIPLNRMQI